jgi:tripartite ATP-independent transporter DctM subunit
MDPMVVGILSLVAFLILMFIGLPVAFSMLVTGVVGLVVLRSPAAAFQVVSSDLFQNFSSYTLSVAPLFGLMGFLASYSGIGANLFNAADKFIGHVRGGISSATQIACAVFGAICGSIPATIATMSSVAYPEMKKRNYAPSLSTSSIAAGSSLSVLIPPSSTFIVYGIAAEESIGRLFISGIVPGLILMLLYIGAIYLVVRRHPDYAPLAQKSTWGERFTSLKTGGLIEVIVIFLISVGGMFVGWFTPTEGASVGAMGILIIGLIERKIDFKKLRDSLYASAKLAAMVFVLIACASIFGRMFTMSGIPTVLARIVLELDVAPWIIMAVIIAIYFLLGMFVDSLSMILITIPIFYPIVVKTLGYDPVWFGVVIVLVLALGGLTPPVGMNVFVMKGYAKEVPLMTIFSGVWPFVAATLLCLAIVIAFPELALFLPRIVIGS